MTDEEKQKLIQQSIDDENRRIENNVKIMNAVSKLSDKEFNLFLLKEYPWVGTSILMFELVILFEMFGMNLQISICLSIVLAYLLPLIIIFR